MLNHVKELRNCKDLQNLLNFVNKYATKKDTYTYNFKENIKKEKSFDNALVKVWNFALQQDGKYFLGRETANWKRPAGGGAITGLECHSAGHR